MLVGARRGSGVDRPDILEVDLNPVIASPSASALAVDALVVLEGQPRCHDAADEPVLLTPADAVGRPADPQPAGEAQRAVRAPSSPR